MPRLADTLKALADPTRLRIVSLLRRHEELCVCELTGALGLPQYSVSRHLAVLKAAGLVTDWRQGKWMHYSLEPALSAEDEAVLAAICARAAKEPAIRQDSRRVAAHLRPRTNGEVVCCPR
jgi:ArsR family transcriptional regulator